MNRLLELRKKYGYTQAYLAKKLQIAHNTYNQYENEKRQIPDEIKIYLANLYDVSLDYLLGRTTDTNNETIIPLKSLNVLIDKAQGDRTLENFATDCNVDIEVLTQIFNGTIQPTTDILKNIALNAQNNVTYADLMIAANLADFSEMSGCYFVPEDFKGVPIAFFDGIKDLEPEDFAKLNEYIDFIKERKKNNK